MAKARIAVIGAGGIARGVHLPALEDIPECEVVALCDLAEEKARRAAADHSIPGVYTSHKYMLEREKPDGVLVLVRPDEMFRVTLDVLSMGCHALAEKPPGITLFQAQTLARAAGDHQAQCQVGFNRRFIPLVREVMTRLAPLGPVHQVDGWFYKHGDAAFYDGCASAFACDTIHVIDLVRHIAGSEARQALTLPARYGDSPVDNAWNALVAFENGVTGTIHANYETGGRVHGFAVHTGAASAYINLGFGGEACSARILHHVEGTFSLSAGGAGRQEIEDLDGLALAGSGDYYNYYGYLAQDRAFVQAIVQGCPVSCGIEDALGTMRLVDMLEHHPMKREAGL